MDDMTNKTVPVGPTPGLKRHALEAAQRLSMYAAAPFFPDVEKRGMVRQTTPEWWDGLANEIEEAQPLIHRAILEMAAPPSPVTELEVMLAEVVDGILTADSMCSDACLIQSDDLQSRANRLHHDSMEKARAALAAFNAKKGG